MTFLIPSSWGADGRPLTPLSLTINGTTHDPCQVCNVCFGDLMGWDGTRWRRAAAASDPSCSNPNLINFCEGDYSDNECTETEDDGGEEEEEEEEEGNGDDEGTDTGTDTGNNDGDNDGNTNGDEGTDATDQGGQGGNNDNDDGTAGDGTTCSCDSQLACDLADEYESYHPGTWDCNKFKLIDAAWRPGPTGYEAKHGGYGRVEQSLISGVARLGDLMEMPGLTVTSGYRCPVGHSNLTGRTGSKSQHQYGTAADLNAATGRGSEWIQEFKDRAARRAVEVLHAGYSDNDYTDVNMNHIHVDWGPYRCSPWQTHEENSLCPVDQGD